MKREKTMLQRAVTQTGRSAVKAALFGMLMVLISLSGVTVRAAAQDALPETVFLWPAGSPTLKGLDEKEKLTPPNPKPGQRIGSIRNVHNPSIEVHLAPAAQANGTAMLVAPGGGHQQLVWASEGTDIAKWLNGIGVTAFVLKYRLAQTPNYHYTVEGDALQDTQQAMRIIRARAKEWGVTSIAFPMMGCGVGGLDWKDVEREIRRVLGPLDMEVELYGPDTTNAGAVGPRRAVQKQIGREQIG